MMLQDNVYILTRQIFYICPSSMSQTNFASYGESTGSPTWGLFFRVVNWSASSVAAQLWVLCGPEHVTVHWMWWLVDCPVCVFVYK